MNSTATQKWTGFLGISIYVLIMIEITLYFIYSGVPPLWNILTRILVDMVLCIVLTGFWVGFRSVIIQKNKNYETVATFILSIALSYVILLLVANSIQVGSVWANNGSLDPTEVGSGGEGALLIYGPVNRLLIATLLITSGKILAKTKIVPVWTSWLAYFIGAFNFALIPSLFFMSEAANFYSANGWNIPIASGLFMLWILIVSIIFIRTKNIYE